MKKIISTLCICLFMANAQSQLVIQKAYTPQDGDHYFEIYNNSNTLLDIGCYSLVTHFQNISEEGFYVVKFPSMVLQPKELMKLGAEEKLNPENPLNNVQLGWNFLGQKGMLEKFVLNENAMQLSPGTISPANYRVKNVFRNEKDYVEHIVLILQGSNVVDASVDVDADKNLPGFLDRLPSISYNNTCGTRVTLNFIGLKSRYQHIFNRPNEDNEYGYFKEYEVRKNSTSVQIAWQTLREKNNNGFYIERKTGTGPWTSVAYVASVAPGGNSNEALQYYYSDKNILNEKTEYRLRQVDMNGRTNYSLAKPPSAEEKKDNIIIYPNPSTDGRANISFGQVNALRDVQVLDINGQLIQQWVSVNSYSQQLQNLRRGQYIVRVIERQTGAMYTEMLMVQ